MHVAQWMHTTAPCCIHWISLGGGAPCVCCASLLFLLDLVLVGCLGTRYSGLAGWPENLDRAYIHYPCAGEM